MMETTKAFHEFNLHENLLAILDKAGFKSASPIQDMTIGPILEGKDIFAQAKTGSGKTGSFAIPIIEQLIRDNLALEKYTGGILYIVLSPTRELAQQTHKVFQTFGKDLGVDSVCVIGGESIEKQKQLISEKAQVLVATPGRMCDLIKQKVACLKNCRGVVFDEADRLFDMGFQKDIDFILKQTPKSRQLIMVSATSNMEVLQTAYRHHSDPLELRLNQDDLMVKNIDQKLAIVTSDEKMPLLVKILRNHEDPYALVFCNTQIQTHVVAEWLKLMDFKAMAISGGLSQSKRTKLLEDFRNKKVTVLVCTDVAARGLDINDIRLVINYDLPFEAANYVHRIGRTGRAGKKGEAYSFCDDNDCMFLDPIYELIDQSIPKMKLTDEDFEKDIPPRPYIDSKTLTTAPAPERKRSSSSTRGDRGDRKRRDDHRSSSSSRQERPKTKREATNSSTAAPSPKRERKVTPPPSFEVECYSEREAVGLAMAHFKLEDATLLNKKILETGRKKFFFFGPIKTKYQFFARSKYKGPLQTFVVELIKKAHLNLHVSVSDRGDDFRVYFKGADVGLLLHNRQDLLSGLEYVLKYFLRKKLGPKARFRLSVACETHKDKENKEERLTKMALKAISDVKKNKEEVVLKPLSPADRRIVHQLVEQDQAVQSSSEGDGRFKKVKISLA